MTFYGKTRGIIPHLHSLIETIGDRKHANFLSSQFSCGKIRLCKIYFQPPLIKAFFLQMRFLLLLSFNFFRSFVVIIVVTFFKFDLYSALLLDNST